VNRRARQNKRSGPRGGGTSRNSVVRRDLGMSGTWNVISQSDPTYNHIQLLDNKPYTIQQTVNYTTVFTSSTTVPQFFAKSFSMSDLTQATQLLGVFDQYRIDHIWLKIVPGVNNSATSPYGSAQWYSALDYDDASTPGSISVLTQYANCITTATNVAHYRHLTPHIAVAAYSGTFTSFKNEVADWIDSGSPNVQHYGLKAAVDVTTSTQISFTLYATFTLSFRNVF